MKKPMEAKQLLYYVSKSTVEISYHIDRHLKAERFGWCWPIPRIGRLCSLQQAEQNAKQSYMERCPCHFCYEVIAGEASEQAHAWTLPCRYADRMIDRLTKTLCPSMIIQILTPLTPPKGGLTRARHPCASGVLGAMKSSCLPCSEVLGNFCVRNWRSGLDLHLFLRLL